ncbi:MAG: glycosyltransferase family 4 protein [Betaproteobacteria bacterium]|nr:glycosyltransferase family 4 protein [Betaproteobacteria bacterium]
MSDLPESPRVAHFVETLTAGGAEMLAMRISGVLADRGWGAHLVVARADGPLRCRVPETVRLGDLGCDRNGGGPAGALAYFLSLRRRLEAYLRVNRIDVLQCHLPMANFLGLVMARRQVCPVLPTVHNEREFDYGGRGSWLRRPLRKAAYRRLLHSCSAMVAVSEQARTAMIGALGADEEEARRIVVIPNGVPAGPRAGKHERAAARTRWNIPGDAVLIVGMGRLTAQKDFPHADRGARRDRRDEPRLAMCHRRRGRAAFAAEQLARSLGISQRCRFAGHVDNTAELLRAADVFCLPSTFEGMPLAVLEAMSHDLPVIATDLPVLAELVQDGLSGRLVPVGDSGRLAGALREAVADEARRRQWGHTAGEAVRRRHDLDVVVDRLEAIYREARASRRGENVVAD